MHGNYHDFQRVLDRYEILKRDLPGLQLVFLGDLVHGYNAKTDKSIDIVLQMMHMGANRHGSCIHFLMGNHELAHVYHWALKKGNWDFTTGFERKMGKRRAEIVHFFEKLPIGIATLGGVFLHHTGASPVYANGYLTSVGLPGAFLCQMDHAKIKAKLGLDINESRFNLEIGRTVSELHEGKTIWETWMNGNEMQYGVQYSAFLNQMLAYYSIHTGIDLGILVTGHIGVDTGVELVAGRQIRLCSGQGCTDDLQKKMLFVDAARHYPDAVVLEQCTLDVY